MSVNIEVIVNPGDWPTYTKAGQMVTCHYTLTLTNGKKIDSSRNQGKPFQFSIRQGEVIANFLKTSSKYYFFNP
jgi:FKBP-type peptidyl-prolyl cis-trans isomerase